MSIAMLLYYIHHSFLSHSHYMPVSFAKHYNFKFLANFCRTLLKCDKKKLNHFNEQYLWPPILIIIFMWWEFCCCCCSFQCYWIDIIIMLHHLKWIRQRQRTKARRKWFVKTIRVSVYTTHTAITWKYRK